MIKPVGLGCTLLMVIALGGWLPAALATEEAMTPVVWSVDNLKQIGGQLPTVLGAPRVVREFWKAAVFFDGKDDGLLLPDNPLAGWSQFTIEVLFCPKEGGSPEQRFLHVEDSLGSRALIDIRVNDHGGWWLDTFLFQDEEKRLALNDPARVHPINHWYWVALRYDGKSMTSFVDGEKESEGAVEFKPMTSGRVSLGVRQNKVSWFKGGIRTVRFSPAALDPAALQRVSPKPTQ